MDHDAYRSPFLYDLEYGARTVDVPYYLALTRSWGDPVLELGCGNGRLSLPLARAGVAVWGVDISEPMLADLARKVAQEPREVRARLKWTTGDFRDLHLQRHFPLVLLPFNALHHCRSHAELKSTLQGIHQVLEPGGHLAFDCYLPDPTLYQRDPTERHGLCTLADPRSGEDIESWETGWWEPRRRVHHVTYVYRMPGGEEQRLRLSLHMYTLRELRDLVDQAGFEPVQEASDFEGTPMGPGAVKWVVLLRRR